MIALSSEDIAAVVAYFQILDEIDSGIDSDV